MANRTFKVTVRNIEIEVEQLENGKFKVPSISKFVTVGLGSTWLDDARIPFKNEEDLENRKRGVLKSPPRGRHGIYGKDRNDGLIDTDLYLNLEGRFPANLCCSSEIDVNIKALLEAKKVLHENP